jgi:hypothetical protein
MSNKKLRPRERDSIIQSLKAGVTPKVGIQHIQVGRSKEVEALVSDIDRVSEVLPFGLSLVTMVPARPFS